MTSKAEVMFPQHLTFFYDCSLGSIFMFFKERQSSAWLPYTKCNPTGTVGTLETKCCLQSLGPSRWYLHKLGDVLRVPSVWSPGWLADLKIVISV